MLSWPVFRSVLLAGHSWMLALANNCFVVSIIICKLKLKTNENSLYWIQKVIGNRNAAAVSSPHLVVSLESIAQVACSFMVKTKEILIINLTVVNIVQKW